MYTVIVASLIVALFGATGLTEPPTALPSEALPHQSIPGDELFGKADFTRAESAYALTLRHDPHNAGAELGLARIALYRNQLEKAERLARAFATDAPSDRRASALLRFIAERRDEGPDYRIEISGVEVNVPFVQIDPLPELEAFVNGKRANLLIDTGGPGLDLAPSFVKPSA
jgi:hypothetical protein